MVNIERFDLVLSPGRPIMSLATASSDELNICLTASNRAADAYGQTVEILQRMAELLAEGASSKQHILMSQVWLRDLADLPAFTEAWNAWIDHDNAPACSVVQAHLARPDILVEVKLVAVRSITQV